jgi:hypothetical protein
MCACGYMCVGMGMCVCVCAHMCVIWRRSPSVFSTWRLGADDCQRRDRVRGYFLALQHGAALRAAESQPVVPGQWLHLGKQESAAQADDSQVCAAQRSVQPRIDEAPGVVSKKNLSIVKSDKSAAKPPLPQQQVFEKKPAPPPAIKKPADPAAEVRDVAASEPGAGPTLLSWEEAEARLREWDMNTRFGPCMSMTRLERWNRAKKLDLDPPVFIHNVMKAFPELKDKSVWHNRVHPDEPIIGAGV